MIALRWLLVVPAAIAAWYVTFIVGAFTYSFIEAHLCPSQDLFSGVCTSQSIRIALDVVMHVFVALSAIAVIAAAVTVAPSRKRKVAWVAFSIGAATALYFAVRTQYYTHFVAALAGGLGALALLNFRSRPVLQVVQQ